MDPIVETCHGRVEGFREGGLEIFLGIPYAGSTQGARRWRPPAPPRAWSGVRPARKFGAAAPQSPGLMARLLGADGEPQSEECLFVNLWTPACDGGRRPVLVWIHGGGFTLGSGGWPVYDGGALARRGDAVVVSFNYRLGALGYVALPGAAAEDGGSCGNFGLLDQVAALEWVRDHASRFGGDPGCVTLFGSSAGAMSVATLLGVPRARGLFHRAILQSGAAHNVHAPEQARTVAGAFEEELGMKSHDPAVARAVRPERVLEVQLRTAARLAGSLPTLAYQPVVDGELLPRHPLDAVEAGDAPPVPLLIGTNLDEWRYWGLGDPGARQLDEAALLRRCRRNLPGVDASGRPHADRIVETYRGALAERGDASPSALWFAIESDRWFRYPAMRLAERHRGPVYAYLFTWASPALGGALGACHSLEVPFVFGHTRGDIGRRFAGEDPAAHALSERMQDAWLAFARSGEPAAAGLPRWSAYRASDRTTMLLGREPRLRAAPFEAERSVWESLA